MHDNKRCCIFIINQVGIESRLFDYISFHVDIDVSAAIAVCAFDYLFLLHLDLLILLKHIVRFSSPFISY